MADPFLTPPDARPPWYLLAPLALMEALSFLPKMLRGVIPEVILAIVLVLPFLDRESGSGARRKLFRTLGIVLLVGWGALTWIGCRTTRPATRRGRTLSGRRKFPALYSSSCIVCGMAYRAAIIGGSGYTGAELLRLLSTHPDIEIVHVTADSNAGASVASLYPSLAAAYPGLEYGPMDPAAVAGLDLVFLAMPHGASQGFAPRIIEDVGCGAAVPRGHRDCKPG